MIGMAAGIKKVTACMPAVCKSNLGLLQLWLDNVGRRQKTTMCHHTLGNWHSAYLYGRPDLFFALSTTLQAFPSWTSERVKMEIMATCLTLTIRSPTLGPVHPNNLIQCLQICNHPILLNSTLANFDTYFKVSQKYCILSFTVLAQLYFSF